MIDRCVKRQIAPILSKMRAFMLGLFKNYSPTAMASISIKN